MGEATVRRTAPTEGLTIARIQLEVWQVAFAGILPDELLRADPELLAGPWSQLLADGSEQVLLAVETGTDEQPAGFAHAGGSDGTIHLLYVRPAWTRRGHGGRLFAGASAQLIAAGADHGVWWLPETDRASQAFASSVGWQADGRSRVLDTGEGRIRELRWSGDLYQDLLPG